MDPVRWGFLGAGLVATRALAPAVHAADGAVLTAAASRSTERAAALRPVRVHAGYDDLLADPEVEAVYLALSNEAHLPWTLAALAAGKHVLCEKPLTLDAAGVREIAAAAAAARRLAVEAVWYRWHPRIRAAERALAAGAVGQVRRVGAGFSFAGVPAASYRWEPARGGGALYDVGGYPLSAVGAAVGWAEPTAVAARVQLAAGGVDRSASVRLDFPTATATVRVDMAGPERQWLVVRGSSGRLALSAPVYTAWSADPGRLVRTDPAGTRSTAFAPVDAYRLMVEQVSAAVRGDPTGFLVPLRQSEWVARIIDAVRAAGSG